MSYVLCRMLLDPTIQENIERNFEIQQIVKIHSNRVVEVWCSAKIVHLMFIPKQHVVDIEGEKNWNFEKPAPSLLEPEFVQ